MTAELFFACFESVEQETAQSSDTEATVNTKQHFARGRLPALHVLLLHTKVGGAQIKKDMSHERLSVVRT